MQRMTDADSGKIKRQGITLPEMAQLSPRRLAAIFVTGHQLFQQGRLKDAASLFQGVILLSDAAAYAHGMLGAICQKQGALDVAVGHYTEALRCFPQDINSLTNRGELYLRLGLFQEAATDLMKAIELDPGKQHKAANRARLLVCLVQDAIRFAKEKGTQALEKERRKARKAS